MQDVTEEVTDLAVVMHDQHVRLCHGVLHSKAYNWTLCRSSDSLFERHNPSRLRGARTPPDDERVLEDAGE